MTKDHKLRVASLSKVMVGVAAMLLWEDGIIDPEADISDYWEFPVANPYYPDIPITIRSLLNHTSSLMSYDDDPYASYYTVYSHLRYSGFTNRIPGDMASYTYNNFAFRTLGLTLELACGQRLDDLLREDFYGPLE